MTAILPRALWGWRTLGRATLMLAVCSLLAGCLGPGEEGTGAQPVTVNVGILEIGGILDDGGLGLGGLGNGTGATSSMGDLSVARIIDLGTNNFDGRRYDAFGGGDGIVEVSHGRRPRHPSSRARPPHRRRARHR